MLTAVAAFAAPSAAWAQEPEEPQYIAWPSLLPALSTDYAPSTEEECRRGHSQCLDIIIGEMERRLAVLAASCDHDSIFALSYLRTTEEFQRARETPGFFEDPAFITHEGAVFASIYLDAYDDWHSPRRASTPAAWAIAFDAAADRAVPASGNLLLGMNAHIQRDRPFVLAAIGLTRADGKSRKEDNDQVNVFLNRVADDLIPEITRRFDPSMDDTNIPTTADDLLSFQVVALWREIAWRNAERLVEAPTPEARAYFAADIERYAASQAEMIRRLTSYGFLRNSSQRDAHCAAQLG